MVSSGRFSVNRFVELTATTPARTFGCYPQKGTLLPGADADLVLWDPEMKVKYGVDVAQHRTDYNLYEGFDLTGFPVMVLAAVNSSWTMADGWASREWDDLSNATLMSRCSD